VFVCRIQTYFITIMQGWNGKHRFFLWHVLDKHVLLLEIKHAWIHFTSFSINSGGSWLLFCQIVSTYVRPWIFRNVSYNSMQEYPLIAVKFWLLPYMHAQNHSTSPGLFPSSYDLGCFLLT
jgi:hypothetical protein